MAILLWYIIQGEEVLEINRKIQVHLKTTNGYMIKGSTVRTKDATLRGSRAVLGDFSSRPLEATIFIPEGKTGKLRFRLDKEFVQNWNSRIKLTVHDAYIHVFVDEKQTRILPLKEHLTGIPAEGFIIEKTTIEPSKVVVTGLKSEVSQLQHILTEPIDITGLQKSKSLETSLINNKDHPSKLSVKRVTVNIQVGEKKINKRFANIPIEVDGNNKRTIVKPRHVSIVIQGTPGVLSFIKRSDFRAFLDIRDLSAGRNEKKVQIKIPPDTVLIETFPENAIIEILNR